jgi:hypothetical protein
MLFLDRTSDVGEFLELTEQLSALALDPSETMQVLRQAQKQWT